MIAGKSSAFAPVILLVAISKMPVDGLSAHTDVTQTCDQWKEFNKITADKQRWIDVVFARAKLAESISTALDVR